MISRVKIELYYVIITANIQNQRFIERIMNEPKAGESSMHRHSLLKRLPVFSFDQCPPYEHHIFYHPLTVSPGFQ